MRLLEDAVAERTSTRETGSIPARNSPLLWWHLLSLDAPTVAVVWTWFAAHSAGVKLPLATELAMGLAVWVLYAADRLLDTRALDARADTDDMEARHFFHHRHRTGFIVGIVMATVALAGLLPHLAPDSIRLYLTEGALMAGYFVLIHATPRRAGRRRIPLPKELMVGPFFAAATFIPTVARNPGLRATLLPDAILFAALCCLNCLFIYAWEHPQSAQAAHWTTHRAVSRLALLGWIVVLAASALTLRDGLMAHTNYPLWLYPAACGMSALMLLGLDQLQSSLARPTLRAAADAVLLTPLLLLLCFCCVSKGYGLSRR